jgi:hypothetical protein
VGNYARWGPRNVVGGPLTGEARVVEGEEEFARRPEEIGSGAGAGAAGSKREVWGVADESMTSGARSQWAGAAQSPCF